MRFARALTPELKRLPECISFNYNGITIAQLSRRCGMPVENPLTKGPTNPRPSNRRSASCAISRPQPAVGLPHPARPKMTIICEGKVFRSR
jgi:hypothetical protein